MPSARAPYKLSTLLDLLASKGVREAGFTPDGRVQRVVFGAAPARAEAAPLAPLPRGRQPQKPAAAPSAIDLALNGIAHDPFEIDPEERTH